MKDTSKTPYFKDLSRKDYVVMARRIIRTEGVGAVSIRRLATELGCSSASMYRYFKNLDELLFYAQLDALNGYILELSEQEKRWTGISVLTALCRLPYYLSGNRIQVHCLSHM